MRCEGFFRDDVSAGQGGVDAKNRAKANNVRSNINTLDGAAPEAFAAWLAREGACRNQMILGRCNLKLPLALIKVAG